jgi:Glycosyltransferase family 87
VLALVAGASALGWADDSPLVPRRGGHPDGLTAIAWWFLALLALAFVAYVAGVVLVRRRPPRLALVGALAAAIQLAPLGAPLLLSTDAWTYWDYGRIAAVHDANPYEHPPSAFPRDPAFRWVGTDWRDDTTVYGPAFTLASKPLARAAGSSHDAAAWIFKTLAALAFLGAALLAARLSPRPALALAFAGWNPLLAVHLAGGGHNDAWVVLLVVGALAAGAAGRRQLAGVCWAVASFVKWVPLLLLPLRVLEARATRRPVGHLGLAVTAVALAATATLLFGMAWLDAFATLWGNANRETRFALPHRLEQLGVPDAVAVTLFAAAFFTVYLLLARAAARGHAHLAAASVALLLATPYLAPWYLAWAVPLAAAEDDEWSGLATLVLGAYLLRQTVPL